MRSASARMSESRLVDVAASAAESSCSMTAELKINSIATFSVSNSRAKGKSGVLWASSEGLWARDGVAQYGGVGDVVLQVCCHDAIFW